MKCIRPRSSRRWWSRRAASSSITRRSKPAQISLKECKTPVGAGLLAKASVQSTLPLNVRPPSRASPLPQGICVT
ncbi:hypothetical protein C1894_17395 [Pseudomonas sp. FW305-3-2-15-E-TSA2]|nr:hypothetical protein C1895_18105 [Pseudomonas sp. FW305-3-2-15-E-TSA4]POA40551.1 hypothetical protein C1894_17395 [Pseudomonas sp. FW305-3-2-15-E-TSA2]